MSLATMTLCVACGGGKTAATLAAAPATVEVRALADGNPSPPTTPAATALSATTTPSPAPTLDLCDAQAVEGSPAVSPRRGLADGDGALRLVGHVGGDLAAMVAEDDRVYAAQGPRLLVLDRGRGDQLTLLGEHIVGDAAIRTILPAGDVVYAMTNEPAGLWAVDVSDPRQPKTLGHTRVPTQLPGNAWRLVRRGDTVFAAVAVLEPYGGGRSQLYSIDVADPTQPRLVGCADLGAHQADAFHTPGLDLAVGVDRADVVIQDHVVKVEAGDPAQLEVLSRASLSDAEVPAASPAVSTAAAARATASRPPPLGTPVAEAVGTTAARGGRPSDVGLQAAIVGPSVGDPARSVLVTMEDSQARGSQAWLYLAKLSLGDSGRPGLTAVRPVRFEDLPGSAAAWQLDYRPTPPPTATPAPTNTPDASGFVLPPTPANVRIVDGLYPSENRWLVRWDGRWLDTNTQALDRYFAPAYIRADRALVSRADQLYTYEPPSSKPVGSVAIDHDRDAYYSRVIAVPKPDGPVFLGGDPLVAVDVSDRRNPRVIGRLDRPGGWLGAASASLALVDAGHEVRTVDISDPTAMRTLGSGRLTTDAAETFDGARTHGRSWAIDGCTAYLLGEGVLRRFDLSSPERPVETEHYVMPGIELAVREGLLLAGGGDGLWVLRDEAGRGTGCGD